MDMATKTKFYSVAEAARLVGKSRIRVQQLLSEFFGTDKQIGEKPGREWILVAEDVRKLAELPDRRTVEYKNTKN
jgi:hypothetical protein